MITQLVDEVWTRERCAGCAMCVALCSKQVLYWDDLEHPRLRKIHKSIGMSKFDLDTCSFCQKFCEVACPRLEPAARLQPLEQVSARAVGILEGNRPNEVARNLLIAARASGMIDGALMIDADRSGGTRARVVTNPGEMAEVAGFQQVWTPLLDALNEAVFDARLKNIAIVGTPCASQAVRRLTDSTLERLAPYRRALRLNIALFCSGIYQPEAIQELVSRGLGISMQNVERLVVSPRDRKLYAWLWDGTVRGMDLAEVEAHTRAGCARCDDYLGESADIAIGPVGAREGYAAVIVRSAAGDAALRNARLLKLIETENELDLAALERARSAKGRRERAQQFDALQILMLDALRDPTRRAEVKQKLNTLYGESRQAKRKEYGNAGCGDCSGC